MIFCFNDQNLNQKIIVIKFKIKTNKINKLNIIKNF